MYCVLFEEANWFFAVVFFGSRPPPLPLLIQLGTVTMALPLRGPAEIVQHSAYMGSSHQRKGATSHLIDMVWLYRSPIYPSGKMGGNFLVQMISTCLR
jgi:hypothetical protein